MVWQQPQLTDPPMGPTDEIKKLQHRLLFAYSKNSRAKELGVTESGIFDEPTSLALKNIQAFIGGVVNTQSGVLTYDTKKALGVVLAASPPTPAFRNIWLFSAPGSGAPWWIGPSFEVGKWCQDVLHINHQPVGYPIGGYMGLMGGDPGLSYNEVIAALGAELEHLLDTNPHVQQALADALAGRPTDIEFWFSAYSQSADGMEDALERLFGDGGKYAPLRSRINGTLMFGNPSRQPKDGPAPGWGIARKIREPWLRAVTKSITATSPGAPDFYAACDDEIRPLFYYEIVQSETSLSFFQHLVKIVIPILINFFASLAGGLGGILGGLVGMIGSAAGLPSSLAGQAVAVAQDPTEDSVTAKLKDLFTVKGIITNIPALFKLLGSVGGVMTHGEYHLPKAEFNGRTGIQVACDSIASFRR